MNFQLKACLFLFVKTDIACALLKESLQSKNKGRKEPISVLDLGTSPQDHQLCCTHKTCHSAHINEHTNVNSRSSQGLSEPSRSVSICYSPTVHGHEIPIEPPLLAVSNG